MTHASYTYPVRANYEMCDGVGSHRPRRTYHLCWQWTPDAIVAEGRKCRECGMTLWAAVPA